jgi:RNA polymerase sigma-70 factor (ECF subfamily)
MIYAYCRRRSGSREEAEDICSQVFMRALQGIHTFRGGMVSAWLVSIARNEVASYYRKNRYFTLPIDAYNDVGDEQDIQEEVEQESSRQTLAKLVKDLPQEQRDLLALSFEQGLSSFQIGQRLRQNPITVRTRLRRIKHSLRTQYNSVTAEPIRRISD